MHSQTHYDDLGSRTRPNERRRRTASPAGLVLAGSLLSLSCSPSSPADPGQTQGAIEVSVSTTGTGQPASFTVRLDGGSARSVSPDGSVVYGSLAPGNYDVELTVPANCSVSGSASRAVGVQEGSTSSASFSVTCSAVPTGAIGVTTSTTGTPPDPDGYAVSVDGGSAQSIGVNGTRLLADLTVGDHVIELSGAAANCLVQGENPRTVSVSQNQTTQTEFEVVCSPTTGQIDVTVTTTGEDIDPDGYEVDVDGVSPRPVDANGSVSFTGVPQGARTVTLQGLAPNCTVTGDNPVTVEVIAGDAVDASFSVECEATAGDLQVSASTSGSQLDPNGYGVSVDGGAEQALAVNGTTVFENLAPGDHEVQLNGVAVNCSVAGSNPRTVDVTAGASASTTFDVTCASTVGAIDVTVTTTGDAIDVDGYSVVLDGGASVQLVDTNDQITFGGIVPGDHIVALQNVAGNCTVTSDNPATADVTAGATADVGFTVECEELTGDIRAKVSTRGSQLDSSYTLLLDGGDPRSITANGSQTYAGVVIGDHDVELTAVASNCQVQGSNPRYVTVSEGATALVDFEVVCAATTGQIEVTVSESGENLDPDGYTVDLDGVSSQPVDEGDPALFSGVTEGLHTLTLQNVAGNCSVGTNPQQTTVTAGQTATVSFTVTCTRTTGDIRVTTSTTGPDEDPSGYAVQVGGIGSRSLDADDSTLFADLQPDDYTVTISDVALNCTVSGGTTRNVEVNADQETAVTFDVSCSPLVGDLQVNVSTTGPDQDVDGYSIRLDNDPGTDVPVDVDDTFVYEDLPTGIYSITLVDVANNCTIVGPDVKSGTVAFGTTETVDFDVECTQRTGSVEVSVSTSGQDPDGTYSATLVGVDSKTVSDGSPATFSGVPVGEYTVTLSDIATNCSDDDGDEQEPVTVTQNGTSPVSFSITCTQLTGSVQVSVTTSGQDQDGTYTAVLSGGQGSQPVTDASPATFTDVPVGNYTVSLTDIADNCTDDDGDDRQEPVSVSANTQSPVSFSITCDATTGWIRVTTTSSGASAPDPNGYLVSVDGGTDEFIDDTNPVVVPGLTPVSHEILLSGAEGTCTIDPPNPVSPTVVAGDTVPADFTVTCP